MRINPYGWMGKKRDQCDEQVLSCSSNKNPALKSSPKNSDEKKMEWLTNSPKLVCYASGRDIIEVYV